MPCLCLQYLVVPILTVLGRGGIEGVSTVAEMLDSERVHDPLVLIDNSRSHQSLFGTSTADGSERGGGVDMLETTWTR